MDVPNLEIDLPDLGVEIKAKQGVGYLSDSYSESKDWKLLSEPDAILRLSLDDHRPVF